MAGAVTHTPAISDPGSGFRAGSIIVTDDSDSAVTLDLGIEIELIVSVQVYRGANVQLAPAASSSGSILTIADGATYAVANNDVINYLVYGRQTS